jgi:polyhydroxyalkanoate depolymerase
MHLVENFIKQSTDQDPALFLQFYDQIERQADLVRAAWKVQADQHDLMAAGIAMFRALPAYGALKSMGFMPWDMFAAEGQKINTANAKFLRHLSNPYENVPYDWSEFTINHKPVKVQELSILDETFFRVEHMARSNPDGSALQRKDPKVVVFVPASGHGPSLLEETVQKLARDHEVYIAYQKNVKDIPAKLGAFGFDDMVDCFIRTNESVTRHDPYGDGSGAGQRANNLPVCQPGPGVLAATAFMAQERNPATPLSLIALASPIDTSIAPQSTNDYAHAHSMDWFKNSVIFPVHPGNKGEGRRAYPGHIQRLAFLFKNPASTKSHMERFQQFYRDLMAGNDEAVNKKVDFDKKFFFDIMDMDEAMYLDTIRIIFKDNLIAKGLYTHKTRGRADLSSIRETFIHAADGTQDDICGFDPKRGYGQTGALLQLTPGVPDSMKSHNTFKAGHYMFSGSAWQKQVGAWTAQRVRMSDTQANWSPLALENMSPANDTGLAASPRAA